MNQKSFKKLGMLFIASCLSIYTILAVAQESQSKTLTNEKTNLAIKKSPSNKVTNSNIDGDSKNSNVDADANALTPSRIVELTTHSKNKEKPAKVVERTTFDNQDGCHVFYEPEQYKIYKPSFIKCFSDELTQNHSFDCLTLHVSASFPGGVKLNKKLLKQRENSIRSTMHSLFPNLKNFKVKKDIKAERSVYVMLSKSDSNGRCFAETPAPTPVCPAVAPLPAQEVRKMSVYLGAGILSTSNNANDYVNPTMVVYNLGMTADITNRKDWGGLFYGGINYMHAATQKKLPLDVGIVYHREDVALLGGLDYKLLKSRLGLLSAFLELGPSYSIRSLNSGDIVAGDGVLYKSYFTFYLSAGLKYTIPQGVFARARFFLNAGEQENFGTLVTISGLAYGGLIDLGYTF